MPYKTLTVMFLKNDLLSFSFSQINSSVIDQVYCYNLRSFCKAWIIQLVFAFMIITLTSYNFSIVTLRYFNVFCGYIGEIFSVSH